MKIKFTLLFLALNCQLITSYKFFIKSSIASFKTTNGQVEFTWETDTCTGAADGGGNPYSNPIQKDGRCFDERGNLLGAAEDPQQVFPRGFDRMYLRAGQTQIDLLGRVSNNANLAFREKKVVVNAGDFESNFYSLVLIATDAKGFQVQGVSYPVGFIGRGALPPPNRIIIHSPLSSSFWLANADYRVRYEIDPSQGIPDAYHLDLLTPDEKLIARVREAAFPLANDTLFGTSRLLNYTIWKIPKELANRPYKLRLTGVAFDGNIVSAIEGLSQVTGVFYIGPPKP